MRVLLVDHDSESLDAIARAIRGVLELDCVTSKGDALLLLRQNQYDVLIACERAVDGSGLDLLARTTRTSAPLKRIFAAAPERLQLLGPRLAPFKVQRTINYPIDLEELWLAIAQVTGGPDDGTDGTIERVVLDERGIPSTGTTSRGPIPPRPPAPLAAAPVPPPPAPAPPAPSDTGRMRALAPPPPSPADTGRMRAVPPAPPAPPNPSETGRMIRALTPPQPRAPAPSDTGRMRALAPPMHPIGPIPVSQAAPPTIDFPAWTPENSAARQDDEFAQISAQARLGVQQKVVDEASRRKTQRVLVACGAAIVVAGGIVFLIEKFYDPEARAREAAIAATVQQMADQQKVTDNLTLIEIDIENAIMNNDLEIARRELAKLVDKSPNHPRREFLQASIDRAAALAPSQAAVVSSPSPSNNSRPVQRPRVEERTPERVASRQADIAPPPRSTRGIPQNGPRSFGAPIGESAGQPTIPLNAPINSAPVSTVRRSDNSFVGRTLEAGDNSPLTRSPQTAPVATTTASSSVNNPSMSGSAAVGVPPAAAPQPSVALDVVPARVVKRVAPVAPLGISRKTAGFVVVKFNISDTGKVSDVEVVESSPQGIFDDAAQSAVRKWMYEPRKENGAAVASQAKARLVFDAAD